MLNPEDEPDVMYERGQDFLKMLQRVNHCAKETACAVRVMGGGFLGVYRQAQARARRWVTSPGVAGVK